MENSFLGSDCFFRSGVTIACLKSEGKIPSERDRLIRCVMGWVKESMQAFNSLVGIRSREQEELEEPRIIVRISCSVTGLKQES